MASLTASFAQLPTPFHSAAWERAAWSGDASARVSVTAGPLWITAAIRSAPCHYYHHPASLIGGDREAEFVGELDRQRWLSLDWSAVMTVVTPFGYRGGPAWRDLELDGARSLAAALVDEATRRGCSCVLSHYLFDGENAAWIRALKELGGEVLTLGAHSQLELWFGKIAEYHSWLGCSRRTVKSPRSWTCRDAEVACIDGPLDDEVAVHLTELVCRRLARFDAYGPPRELIEGLITGRLLRRTMLWAVEPGVLPRSVLISIPWGRTLFAKYFASSREKGDYIPLVFNHQIAHALGAGFERIDLGGAAHQTKLFRGARLRLGRGVLLPLTRELRAAMPLARRASAHKEKHFLALRERWEKAAPQPGSCSTNPQAT